MVWIRITLPQQAQGALAASYRKLGAPPARLDQVILARAERPHTLDDGSWIVDAGATIRMLNRRMNWDLPATGAKTLNGVIM